MLRPIITIDEDKCNGCGQCITDCAEGALALVNGKAKVISDSYCDGLGACLNCPQHALQLEMRDAAPFDEAAALSAKAAREQASKKPQPLGLGGAKAPGALQAMLPSWPIQLALCPARARFFDDAHLLLVAQCAAFALPNFHKDWLAGRIPLIACPKLQDNAILAEKLRNILANNRIASLEVLRMSVPCCSGLERIAKQATEGLDLPFSTEIVQL